MASLVPLLPRSAEIPFQFPKPNILNHNSPTQTSKASNYEAKLANARFAKAHCAKRTVANFAEAVLARLATVTFANTTCAKADLTEANLLRQSVNAKLQG